MFWAIRGGGGNYGVVTTFRFKTYPIANVLGGPTFFHIDGAVLRRYEKLMTEAPEQLNSLLAFTCAPAAPFVPESWHGQPVLAMVSCWHGPVEQDQNIIETLADCGEVIGQALWRMPYPEVNTFFDELLPHGLRHYWKAHAAIGFTDEAIKVHVEHGSKVPNVESGLFIFPTNGACHRVDEDETAFANRQVNMSSVISGTWHKPEEDEANTAWVRDYFDALKPHSELSGYVNFMDADDQDTVGENYGPKFQRLKKIKRKYDPDNLFRMNQNIAP